MTEEQDPEDVKAMYKKPLAEETIMVTTFEMPEFIEQIETNIYDNFDFSFHQDGETFIFEPEIKIKTPRGEFNMILEITDSPYSLRAGGMISLGFYAHRVILFGMRKIVGENKYSFTGRKFSKHKEMRDL